MTRLDTLTDSGRAPGRALADPLKSAASVYALARLTSERGCSRLGCYRYADVLAAPIGDGQAVRLQTDHCPEHSDGHVSGWDDNGSEWTRLTPDALWVQTCDRTEGKDDPEDASLVPWDEDPHFPGRLCW